MQEGVDSGTGAQRNTSAYLSYDLKSDAHMIKDQQQIVGMRLVTRVTRGGGRSHRHLWCCAGFPGRHVFEGVMTRAD